MADGTFQRNPSVGDIPTFVEVYEEIYKKPPSGITWRAFVQVQEGADLTRAIVAPKGTQQEAVAILRNAVAAAAQTPEFQREYETLMGESATIVSAEDGTRILRNLDKAPEDVKAFLREYVK